MNRLVCSFDRSLIKEEKPSVNLIGRLMKLPLSNPIPKQIFQKNISKKFSSENKNQKIKENNSLYGKSMLGKDITYKDWLIAEEKDKLLVLLFGLRKHPSPSCFAELSLEVARVASRLWRNARSRFRFLLFDCVNPTSSFIASGIKWLAGRGIRSREILSGD